MRLIDADLLTERLNNAIECGRRVDMPTLELEAVLANVQNAPSIDIEPKRGEWIDEADKYDASFGIHDYRCSNCNSYADEYIGGHEWYTAGKPNFCPYCGADMREREDEW